MMRTAPRNESVRLGLVRCVALPKPMDRVVAARWRAEYGVSVWAVE